MADKLRVLKGNIESLPSDINPGSVYFALLNEETGEIYVDYTDENGNDRRARFSGGSQNKGVLKIGNYSYDGSSNVEIPCYSGNAD